MSRGEIIVFSGTDGAGKSTQITLLETELRAHGHRVSRFWARGGYTPVFSFFKKLLRRVRPDAVPTVGQACAREQKFGSARIRRLWLRLAITDLILCYGLWLPLLRLGGRTVLCDRFIEDTLLDFRLKFPQEMVETWWLWRGLMTVSARPNHRLLLLVPPEESVRRAILKKDPFPNSPETLAWRYGQYLQMAQTSSWVVIDCMSPLEAVHREIVSTVFP